MVKKKEKPGRKKNPPANAGNARLQFDSWVENISRSRKPTPVFLPRKSYEQRSLAGYSPWGCKESDTAEHHNGIIMLHVFMVEGVERQFSMDCSYFFTAWTF